MIHVMPGPEPGIQSRKREPGVLDCRVRPGNDESKVGLIAGASPAGELAGPAAAFGHLVWSRIVRLA